MFLFYSRLVLRDYRESEALLFVQFFKRFFNFAAPHLFDLFCRKKGVESVQYKKFYLFHRKIRFAMQFPEFFYKRCLEKYWVVRVHGKKDEEVIHDIEEGREYYSEKLEDLLKAASFHSSRL